MKNISCFIFFHVKILKEKCLIQYLFYIKKKNLHSFIGYIIIYVHAHTHTFKLMHTQKSNDSEVGIIFVILLYLT